MSTQILSASLLSSMRGLQRTLLRHWDIAGWSPPPPPLLFPGLAEPVTKIQERKSEEETSMTLEEEEQETVENCTATGTNDKGNARKKARHVQKQLQREKQGNKREQEAGKTATSAATGAKVSPAFSSPVGARKKGLNSLHAKSHSRTTNICILKNLQRLLVCFHRRINIANLP
jgi:hypothetical protein